MNETYCIKSKKYGKFKNIEITYQFYKTLAISVVFFPFFFFFSFFFFGKCDSKCEGMFKDKESSEILKIIKILDLIKNI